MNFQQVDEYLLRKFMIIKIECFTHTVQQGPHALKD